MATVTKPVTKTVTINAAFLQEIKDASEELRRTQCMLRDMCSRPMSLYDDTAGFVELLAMYRDELAMQFALEEAYGYFDDPIEAAPWLEERAHDLRAEHETLYRQLASVVERAEDLLYHQCRSELIARIPLAFSVFDDQLSKHEHRETELIMAAFDDDIGVGD